MMADRGWREGEEVEDCREGFMEGKNMIMNI